LIIYVLYLDIDDNILTATNYTNIKSFQELVEKSHKNETNG